MSPAPKEFCRRGLRGGAKNSDDPTFAVPKPMSGQCHGDIVAWNQEKSHLERRDDAHAVKRGQSRGSKRVRNSQLQRLLSRPVSTRFG